MDETEKKLQEALARQMMAQKSPAGFPTMTMAGPDQGEPESSELMMHHQPPAQMGELRQLDEGAYHHDLPLQQPGIDATMLPYGGGGLSDWLMKNRGDTRLLTIDPIDLASSGMARNLSRLGAGVRAKKLFSTPEMKSLPPPGPPLTEAELASHAGRVGQETAWTKMAQDFAGKHGTTANGLGMDTRLGAAPGIGTMPYSDPQQMGLTADQWQYLNRMFDESFKTMTPGSPAPPRVGARTGK